MLNKRILLQSLPIVEEHSTIRPWQRADIELLAQWPSYPFPYESLNYRFGAMSAREGDRHFREREDNPDRLTMVLDHAGHRTAGYLALVEIDWRVPSVGNMAVRIAPQWCDRGIGTQLLRTVSDWCLARGFVSVRLDVAASNPRAARCYEKAGYTITGEFWRDDAGLKAFAVEKPEFDFLRLHVRWNGTVPQLRFYWMERIDPGSAAISIIGK